MYREKGRERERETEKGDGRAVEHVGILPSDQLRLSISVVLATEVVHIFGQLLF